MLIDGIESTAKSCDKTKLHQLFGCLLLSWLPDTIRLRRVNINRECVSLVYLTEIELLNEYLSSKL